MPPTFQKTLIFLLGLLISNVHGHEFTGKHRALRHIDGDIRLAKRLTSEPDISRRATFYGGWALYSSTCPEGFDDSSGVCCPKGTFAYSVQLQGLPKGTACCPDSKSSCAALVKSLPICADTSWYLWANDGQYPFCCLKGEVGIWTSGGIFGASSACSPGDINIPQSILASSMILTSETTKYTSSQATATGVNPAATTTGADSPAITTGAGGDSTNTSSGPNPTSSSSTSNTNNTNNSSISTPVVIGIVVVAVIILAALLAFWSVMRKRRRPSDLSVQGGTIPPSYTGAGVGTGQGYPEPKPSQMHYPHFQEVDGTSMAGTPKPTQFYYPPVPEVDGVSAPGTPRPTQPHYPQPQEVDGASLSGTPKPTHAYYPPVQGTHEAMVVNSSYRGELAG